MFLSALVVEFAPIGGWVAMERFKIGVITTLVACALLGMIWKLL
jgi:hypothetical protein